MLSNALFITQRICHRIWKKAWYIEWEQAYSLN